MQMLSFTHGLFSVDTKSSERGLSRDQIRADS